MSRLCKESVPVAKSVKIQKLENYYIIKTKGCQGSPVNFCPRFAFIYIFYNYLFNRKNFQKNLITLLTIT